MQQTKAFTQNKQVILCYFCIHIRSFARQKGDTENFTRMYIDDMKRNRAPSERQDVAEKQHTEVSLCREIILRYHNWSVLFQKSFVRTYPAVNYVLFWNCIFISRLILYGVFKKKILCLIISFVKQFVYL